MSGSQSPNERLLTLRGRLAEIAALTLEKVKIKRETLIHRLNILKEIKGIKEIKHKSRLDKK